MVDIAYIVTVMVVVLMSMTLHEAMHAFMGYWLGDSTAKEEGRLTLNPIRHIDPVLTVALPLILAIIGGPIFGGAKPVPFNPNNVKWGEWGAALVGLAGPVTNLVLSFVFFILSVFVGDASEFVRTFLQLSVIVNLGFFVFNMIPIPPLDGSRVLYAIAPDGIRQVMAMMEQYGIVIILAVVMFGSQFIGKFIQSSIESILRVYAALFGVSVV